MQLSIVIPALNEAKNLALLLPRIQRCVPSGIEYETIVVDGHSRDDTRSVARSNGAKVIVQTGRGYCEALKQGFQVAQGDCFLTMDADLSHDPVFIKDMWAAHQDAEVVIASRYVQGGSADMPWRRKLLSLILNGFFSRGLSLPISDVSSGFRLYNARVIKDMNLESGDFSILQEILVKAYAQGWRVVEIPFHYAPRQSGSSHVKLIRFGYSFLRTFRRMWVLRNSIDCADYDGRAFDSRIPLQRWWQRRRHQIVTTLANTESVVLDVGCGSSVILADLKRAIGVDINLSKLRYVRSYGKPLANASILELPFADESFDCVVCSQVIEHLLPVGRSFEELIRVLRKGGTLILGTPDYGRLSWVIIERLYATTFPGGYADEHIAHYTREGLTQKMKLYGFELEETHYVFGSEMIARFRKTS